MVAHRFRISRRCGGLEVVRGELSLSSLWQLYRAGKYFTKTQLVAFPLGIVLVERVVKYAPLGHCVVDLLPDVLLPVGEQVDRAWKLILHRSRFNR